jgi:hypothetical protein
MLTNTPLTYSVHSAGGMFSSTNDLIKFGEAILEHRVLSGAKTRKWLQPTAHTAVTGFSVGAPWEIGRTNTLTPDNRTLDVYTKTGDLGQYHAVIALIPDYDLVVSVICAGAEVSREPASRTIILTTALRALIPALDQASRAEASSNAYTGTFTSASTNSTLSLTTDSGPGLVISSLSIRGFNALSQFSSYTLSALESGAAAAAPPPPTSARLYPSNRRAETISTTTTDNTNVTETAWRAVIDTATEDAKKKLDEQIFYNDGSCMTWFGMDRGAYNFLSLADFVFVTDKGGKVTAVRSPAFNVTFVRTGDEVIVDRDVGAGKGSTSGASKRGLGWGVVVGVVVMGLGLL